MKADFTRKTFDPFQHFARVLMQQGRVQLDADWNEQAAILLHYMQTLAADLIGPQGGPTSNYGFGVSPLAAPVVSNDFRIGLGRYYVDGILCEADSAPVGFTASASGANTIVVDQWTLDGAPFQVNQLVEVFDDAQVPNQIAAFNPTVVQITGVDQANLKLTLQGAPAFGTPLAPKVRRVITYLTQPDYPVPSNALAAGNSYLIYLDVWERLITYVEDDAIREVALGGPDTAARSKVIWQVKAVAGQPGETANQGNSGCDGFIFKDGGFLKNLFGGNRGRLKAMAKQSAASTNPCIIPPNASYTGPENQLYRVEIHRPGGAWDGTSTGKSLAATFKWSRENGSVAFPIMGIASGNGVTTVTLESLGRDERLGLAQDEWVEIQDDWYVLQNRAENLLQVQAIDTTSLKVTLNGVPGSNVGQDPSWHPLLRGWDQAEGDPADGGLVLGTDGAALIVESASSWLSLEDGIQIQFEPPDSGQPPNLYRTGDYWMIPARTATGDVEWPTEMGKDSQGNAMLKHLAKPPDGIDHHYAPLGVIGVRAQGPINPEGDCRKQFGGIAHQ
jgi:hypothetical protein